MNKKERIEESARKLFLEKGIEQTSVREITENANVAKGTFYLYFEDKSALITHLISVHLENIIHRALTRALEDEHHWIAGFFNAIIDIYSTETNLVKVMEKNLGSPEIKESFVQAKDKGELIEKNAVIEKLVSEGFERQDAVIRMVLALHFTLVTCYGSIVYHSPASLTSVRPYILETVCQMFNRGESSGNI